MKFIVAIFLHAFLAFAVGLYSQFPWWLFVGTSGIVAFFIMDSPDVSDRLLLCGRCERD